MIDDREILLSIEPKYDVEINDKDLPNIMYHVTQKSNLDNIMKRGIVPKSYSKKGDHPDRVYVSINLNFANNFKLELENKDKMIILKIDKNRLINNRNHYTKFYVDSNSLNNKIGINGLYIY